MYAEEKKTRHSRDVANSGDINTATVLRTCVNKQRLHDISYQIGIYHLLHHIHWYYLGQHEWLKFQRFGLCSRQTKIYCNCHIIHCVICWSIRVMRLHGALRANFKFDDF